MSYDEKTTELELPVKRNNIVHVNFFGPRKTPDRVSQQRATNTAPARVRRLVQPQKPKPVKSWMIRLAAVAAIVALSFLVL